ncbi:PREDICTED: transmembrane and coiled-coil domain-containing protein 5A-like [Atta cephalotes]|uniref:Polyamine-modulated factor 1 n=1 Tax=Atta cephalotes TaxID=12957 RepID=A0A158NB26_ATTCE|nr:PREDICTED: transmembrane and coiled-coil domain-containing protein 5A-like [Atta cephalotes]
MGEDEEADCPNNARLFRIAVSNSLKNIAESVSENEFLETLTILKSNPNIAQKLHKAMIKELHSSMNNDLEDILKEGSLQESFTKIAKLSEESTSANEHAWRPPGDVTSHLRSLDAHMIKEATKELEEQVNEMERENETLMKTIAESRSRIRATNDNVMRILNCAPDVLQRLEKTCEQLTTCLKMIENE